MVRPRSASRPSWRRSRWRALKGTGVPSLKYSSASTQAVRSAQGRTVKVVASGTSRKSAAPSMAGRPSPEPGENGSKTMARPVSKRNGPSEKSSPLARAVAKARRDRLLERTTPWVSAKPTRTTSTLRAPSSAASRSAASAWAASRRPWRATKPGLPVLDRASAPSRSPSTVTGSPPRWPPGAARPGRRRCRPMGRPARADGRPAAPARRRARCRPAGPRPAGRPG